MSENANAPSADQSIRVSTSISVRNAICDLSDRISLANKPRSGQQSLDNLTTRPNISLNDNDASKKCSMQNLVDLNQPLQNGNNDTQLHIAVRRKQLRLSLWLIDNAINQPSDLDVINKDGFTALHIAVMTHQANVVRKLVLAGANTEITTSSGYTALHLACDESDVDSVKALTEPFNDEDKDWFTSNQKELPMKSASLEATDKDGYTAFHIAAMHNNVDVIKQLITVRANLDAIESRFGRMPFHMAVENNCRNVIEYLIKERNACLNMLTGQGMSPYEIALNVDKRLAEDLLSLGANPIVRDPELYRSSGESSETNSNDDNFSDESGDDLRRYDFLNNVTLEP